MRSRRSSSSPFSLFSFQDIITSVTGIIILLTMLLAVETLNRRPQEVPSEDNEEIQRLRTAVAEVRQLADQLSAELARNDSRASELAQATPEDVERLCSDLKDQIARLAAEVAGMTATERAKRSELTETETEAKHREAKQQELAALERRLGSLRSQIDQLKRANRLIYSPDPRASKRAWLVEVTGEQLRVAPVGQPIAPVVFAEVFQWQRIRSFAAFAARRDSRRDYFVLLVKPSGIGIYRDLHAQLGAIGFDVGLDLIGTSHTVLDSSSGAVFR